MGAICKAFGVPEFIMGHMSMSRTHAFADAPPLATHEEPRGCPVVLFAHSLGGLKMQVSARSGHTPPALRGRAASALSHTLREQEPVLWKEHTRLRWTGRQHPSLHRFLLSHNAAPNAQPSIGTSHNHTSTLTAPLFCFVRRTRR